MARYIDADALITLLKAHAKDGDNMTIISDITANAIERLPTVDVRENVKAKWIRPAGVLTTMCSNCGYINNSAGEFSFCPNCGAVMERSEND